MERLNLSPDVLAVILRNLTRQAVTLDLIQIGGGPGSFIGPVHRMAAQLDGEIELIAGCFSSDSSKSNQAGRDLGLDPDRWRTRIFHRTCSPDGGAVGWRD